MIRKEVEKLRGMVLTPEELEDVILPIVVASKERDKERVKVHFTKKELTNKLNEELQEVLNKYIEAGFIPPNTTLDDVVPEEE